MRFIADSTELCQVLGIPFSPDQLAAITAPADRPSVIIAGAGSGKTTVMAARVVWLVGHEGVMPGRILGLTFTKKAAAELGRRVRLDLLAMADASTILDLLDAEGEPTVATYNAFAGSLIGEHGLRLGLETDLVVEADAMRFQRAARVIRRYREPLPNLATQMTETVNRVLALDSALSEHLVTPERLREHDLEVIQTIDGLAKTTGPIRDARAAALQRLDLSRLVEAYRADKVASGVMDFGDQMAGGARLGIECPEVGTVLRERFAQVLLDEYQDTSVAQRLMLQGLFGDGHPVSAVGDPAQAIYGWRGASSDNLARFHQHFPAAGAATGSTFGLRVSRRCHPDILAAANLAAAPYYEEHDDLEPLQPAGDHPGDAELTVARHSTITDESAALLDDVVEARLAHPSESIAILLRTRPEMPVLTAGLRARGVDAEVVGLAGLLGLPHVADVVSLLEVAADATANPAILRLLAGDRWRIGPRDLALLGRRAKGMAEAVELPVDDSLAGRLSSAVAGADPTEIVSLSDAVEEPGGLPSSSAALARFAELSAVIHAVRAQIGSSVADLVQLAVRLLDLDIETSLMNTGAADDLAALADVAGDVGGRVGADSLPAFLAYLRAEEEFGQGLEVPERARPGAVQILTIHTAKGLEWDRVFVPFVVNGGFPSTQGRDRWTSNAKAFPYPLRGDADSLPQLGDWSSKGLSALTAAFKADDFMEEVRLAYVAFTRARRALHVSGHWWGRTQKEPRGASPFLDAVHSAVVSQHRSVGAWTECPTGDNPELEPVARQWPPAAARLAARHAAAELVGLAADGRLERPAPNGTPQEDQELALLAELDAELEALREEAARSAEAVEVPLPSSLSATSVLTLAKSPGDLARQLARPMPRQPSSAARLGTRFHAWVEAHYGQQQVLLDPTDLPGRGDVDLASEAELQEVIAQFRSGPYGDRTPAAIEAPFSIVLGGQQVIGRIDAIFERDGTWEVVDWKTNRAATADPLQLAVYRLAWAEMNGLDLANVTGAFYYVRLGEVQPFDDLPGRDELERLVAGESVGS
jgi:DNA helicase-2/ATP-dependent DNA helicase PcrA